jgi:hypothetical protein
MRNAPKLKILILVLISILNACSGLVFNSTKESEKNQRLILKDDNKLGTQISELIEKDLLLKTNLELTIYLRDLADRLLDLSSDLRNSPLGVYLVNCSKGERCRNFGVPGIRIYLSAPVLKRAKNEGEILAALAMEISHIENRHFLKSLKVRMGLMAIETVDLQSVQKMPAHEIKATLAYEKSQYLEAIPGAVKLLYGLGVDPRSLLSYWSSYEKSPSDTPFEKNFLEELKQKSFDAISGHPPIRNPILKSKRYDEMAKTIANL